MKENESKALVRGALLLTLAGIVSKVLSAGYRIPLQNLTGDIGFYIYQQVYPILGMGLVLSLYGFPSAISKLTADLKQEGKEAAIANFYVPVLLIMLFSVGIIAGLFYINAEKLAVLAGDSRLITAYKIAALSFVIIPFTSLLRGLYQGTHQMMPTAYSQIGEQLIRVSIIITAAVYVSSSGADLYVIGISAGLANLSGGLCALFILILFIGKNKPLLSSDYKVPWSYYLRTILLFGFAASLNHMVLLFVQFADMFTLVPALMDYGLTQIEAMEAKGVLDRGQPLIQLGTVLGSSFALAMIPSISKRKLKENPLKFYQNIRSGLVFSLYLAAGATAGLIAIMPEANRLLFADGKGTMELRVLMLVIILSGAAITASTVLQGMGYIKRTAVFILIALFIKWMGNILIVPLTGIIGSAVATNISLLSLFLLTMFELRRRLPKLGLFRELSWSALFFAVMGMLLYISFIQLFIPSDLSRLGALVYVFWIAGTGGIIYFIILLRGRAFKKEQIHMLPLSHIWKRIYKERK